jgi:hypothetical protein
MDRTTSTISEGSAPGEIDIDEGVAVTASRSTANVARIGPGLVFQQMPLTVPKMSKPKQSDDLEEARRIMGALAQLPHKPDKPPHSPRTKRAARSTHLVEESYLAVFPPRELPKRVSR